MQAVADGPKFWHVLQTWEECDSSSGKIEGAVLQFSNMSSKAKQVG
jgi:hypothetical protein